MCLRTHFQYENSWYFYPKVEFAQHGYNKTRWQFLVLLSPLELNLCSSFKVLYSRHYWVVYFSPTLLTSDYHFLNRTPWWIASMYGYCSIVVCNQEKPRFHWIKAYFCLKNAEKKETGATGVNLGKHWKTIDSFCSPRPRKPLNLLKKLSPLPKTIEVFGKPPTAVYRGLLI
jgi:hypothetical protein